MRVAFVGASGIIGRQLIPFLTSKFDLTLFGLESIELEFDGRSQEVHALDITDFEACVRALEGMDAVVNCAVNNFRSHHNHEPESLRNYNEGCIEVNVRGAYHLYEAARRNRVQDFVFISSLTTLLGLPRHGKIDANSQVRPVNIYACTKLFGDQVGQFYASLGDFRVKCLRLGQPYRAFNAFDENWPYQDRSVMVAAEDIARAICASLQATHIQYGAYPIVSYSDQAIVTPDATREIGFEPIYEFRHRCLLRDGVEVERWPAKDGENDV